MEILFIVFALVVGFVLGRYLPKKIKTDGGLVVSKSDTSKIYRFEFTIEPEELSKRKYIFFNVTKEDPS